jgi:D-alanine-D-alanine ligase
MSDICVAFDPLAATVVTRHHPTHAAASHIAAIGEDVGDAPDLAQALQSLGHTVRLLPLGEGAAAQLLGLGSRKPDLVFNLCDTLQGRGDRALAVPAVCELLGVRLIGASAAGLALSKRKHDVKTALCRAGLPTPRYQVIDGPEQLDALELGLVPPVLCKPTGEHASIGIEAGSVCYTAAEVAARARVLFSRLGGAVLVEEYVGGREASVSFAGDPPQPLHLMEHGYEDLTPGYLPIRTFDFKWFRDAAYNGDPPDPRWAEGAPVRQPAVPWSGKIGDIVEVARKAFRTGGGRDWGRVDFRVDAGGVPMVIDVTPNTYLGRASPCARAAEASGLIYEALLDRIVQGALGRPLP